MIAEQLAKRTLYEWRPDKKFDRDAEAVIDKAVRRLVLVMRSMEVKGGMSREDVEDFVIRAMEKAEWLYYGLDELELMSVIDKEIANDNGRKKHRESI